MNRSIVAIALLITATFHAFGQGMGGQGIFDVSNVGTTPDRQIYVGEYMGPVKAEGDGYKIAVYWGPEDTTDENALVLLDVPIGFLILGGAGQFNAGRTYRVFDPSAMTDGPVLTFQARAWDSSTGATWEQAAANPIGAVGKGPIFEMKTKDEFNPSEPFTPRIGDAAGWRGFAITVVPEPSVWGLALVGAATLLFFRRR
jgi:PEP-CTERM motif-containing protein